MTIGDRVMATCSIDGNDLSGQYGIIISTGKHFRLNYGVQFDEPISGGHDCDHQGANGYCWYCNAESLQVIEENIEYEDSSELSDFLHEFVFNKRG